MGNLENLTEQFERNAEFYVESPEEVQGFDYWQIEFEGFIETKLVEIDSLELDEYTKNILRDRFLDFVLLEESALDDDLQVTNQELNEFMGSLFEGYDKYLRVKTICDDIAFLTYRLQQKLRQVEYYKRQLKSPDNVQETLIHYINIETKEIETFSNQINILYSNIWGVIQSVDSLEVDKLIFINFESEPLLSHFFKFTIDYGSTNNRMRLQRSGDALRENLVNLLKYGFDNHLFGNKFLSQFLNIPSLSTARFLMRNDVPINSVHEEVRSLINPTFRNVEGLNEDGFMPSALRISDPYTYFSGMSGTFQQMERGGGYDSLSEVRCNITDFRDGELTLVEFKRLCRQSIQRIRVSRELGFSNLRLRQFKRECLDLLRQNKIDELDDKLVYLHDTLVDHMPEGDGTNMVNIDAFSRVGEIVGSLPEFSSQSELTLSYPGAGAHLSIIETASRLILSNDNLESVNMNLTEVSDVRSDILSLLGHVQARNDALTDLAESFEDVTSEYSEQSEAWQSVYRLSFKIHGKLIKVNLFLNAQNTDTGGHWLGLENIDQSNLVFINDTEGMDENGDSTREEMNNALAIANRVRREGGSKVIVMPFRYYNKQDLEDTGVELEEIYVNRFEQYGSSCAKVSNEGMVVLRLLSNAEDTEPSVATLRQMQIENVNSSDIETQIPNALEQFDKILSERIPRLDRSGNLRHDNESRLEDMISFKEKFDQIVSLLTSQLEKIDELITQLRDIPESSYGRVMLQIRNLEQLKLEIHVRLVQAPTKLETINERLRVFQNIDNIARNVLPLIEWHMYVSQDTCNSRGYRLPDNVLEALAIAATEVTQDAIVLPGIRINFKNFPTARIKHVSINSRMIYLEWSDSLLPSRNTEVHLIKNGETWVRGSGSRDDNIGDNPIVSVYSNKMQMKDEVSSCLSLNFNDLSYLMSNKRKETTKLILDNLDEFITQNLETFKSLITLESTFAVSLLEHLDVLESRLDSELSNVLESIVKVTLVSGNVNELFEHYAELSELYPRLKDLILEDYRVLLEHYEEIPVEVSIDIVSTCLDIALINRDYATLLTYIQLPKFRYFVTQMSANDDTGIINTLRNIEIPIGAEIFNTPDGFEIVEHECEFDDDHRITDMTVRILRYGHDLRLRDEITNIENDCLELEELGINYYNHLVRPYAYLRNIIDSRAAFERRDKTFFENKRFNVTFYPNSDHNGAFNKPVSRYDKDQNNLYFEISSEREFFDTMLELEEFGIHINLLEIGGHGSQGSLSFGGKDSRLKDTSSEPDELQLGLADEQDLRNLGELEVLRGSDILLDSCSNAKTKLASNQQLKMGSFFINMAQMICGTIGCNSRVIASRETSSEHNIAYRLAQYHYGFDDEVIFVQDNRPSDS